MNRSQPSDEAQIRRVKIQNRSVPITICIETDRRFATQPGFGKDSNRCHPPPVGSGVGVGRVRMRQARESVTISAWQLSVVAVGIS